jgi:tetratricopeptide (TPR) repeat protein
MNRPFRQTITTRVQPSSDLAPRAWGEMVIAQLLELENPSLTKLIVAYSQHFHIPNKHCSFLVLETDKEYKQYGLESTKKTQKIKDIKAFLEKQWSKQGTFVSMRKRWILLAQKVAKRYKFINKSSGRTVLSLLRGLPESDFSFPETNATRIWQKQMVPTGYLTRRDKNGAGFGPFVKEAKRRLRKEVAGAVRALSSIVEKNPSNPQALRLVGYYLRAWKRPSLAAQLFWEVLERRSFEPHAFRDVAISLIRMKRYGLAAALYEIMLAGSWHRRFPRFHVLASEEYALLLYTALNQQRSSLPFTIKTILSRRRSLLGIYVRRSALRVTVTWNTDNTDIDLWVIGPQNQKCYYGRKATNDGGRLLQDLTRGYGPERYENSSPKSGYYKVKLHYYNQRTNTFGNETHASIMVVRNAGTRYQVITFKSAILRTAKEIQTIATIKL